MAATVKESSTGTPFPSVLQPPGARGSLVCLGVGVRAKRVVLADIRVYAVALYVDAAQAKEALSSFKSKPAKQLAKDEAFFGAFLDPSFALCVSICFVRDITAAQFANGMKDAIEPHLRTAGAAAGAALQDFMSHLSKQHCATGSRLFLTLEGGAVTASGLQAGEVLPDLQVPQGAECGRVESEPLVAAIKEVFLGKDAVAPSLKHHVAQEAASLLSA